MSPFRLLLALCFWPLVTSANEPLVVAVIDTGVDLQHPLLKPHLWRNPGEDGLDDNGRPRASNGIDDDKNGYVDDVHGWDFVNQQADIQDRHGHGSHVAGLILRSASRGVKLMILKYYDTGISESATLRASNLALNYALKMNAQIINYSGGGYTRSEHEEQLIAKTLQLGVLLVAAAGNEHTNGDERPYFPADYQAGHILKVTSTDKNAQLSPFANFGAASIDLAANGQDLMSALPGNKIGPMSGTSQATALVTGAAAKLWLERPDLRSAERLVAQLTGTAKYSPHLEGKTRLAASVDSFRALQMHQSPAPFSLSPSTFFLK